MNNVCINCGNTIRMMCQLGTDYCSDNCRKEAAGEYDKVAAVNTERIER